MLQFLIATPAKPGFSDTICSPLIAAPAIYNASTSTGRQPPFILHSRRSLSDKCIPQPDQCVF